jgi:hypothetical protein
MENPPPTLTNLPNHPPTITHLIEALTTNDHHIKALIQNLPNNWSGYNDVGTLATKRQLLQSAWGKLKESDSLQAFQQAIITSIPPNTATATTTPTSPLPSAWTPQYGNTPSEMHAKTRSYPTLYLTRSPYSTYTTTPTSQPLSRTITHTTTSTPLISDHPRVLT